MLPDELGDRALADGGRSRKHRDARAFSIRSGQVFGSEADRPGGGDVGGGQ
ncbi:hypothetical protein ACFFX0_05260 [Citricoccus parietis]|uniref:Uncharacterized protein n=1 Tax=Citricoccus parietis TaxID=592307 RepID=A0ABV5FVG6_9MICC